MSIDSAKIRAPSFIRALISNVAGLVTVFGLTLIVALVWQGVASTEEQARQEIKETLDRSVERLQILLDAAAMVAASAERIVLTPEIDGKGLRPALERSLSAFEQRPELSYLGIVLPATGEYGNLERTAAGEIKLWLFPGTRVRDSFTRNYTLADRGFVLREVHPTDGYDPRKRPFYTAALEGPAAGTWIPAYQWIIHAQKSEPLWGLSFVKAVRDGSGRLLCVLDTDFDLPALNGFLKSVADAYRIKLQVVELGPTPRLIVSPDVGRVPLDLTSALTSLSRFPGEDSVGRMRLDGEYQWVATRRMKLSGGVSWLVIASRREPFIAAPFRHQVYEVIGMGVLIVAGLMLLLARMARRFGTPLADLEKRIAGMEQRELMASPPPAAPAVEGFRETQNLGAAFERMVAAIRQREQRIRYLATYDVLTGLPNRNMIQDRIVLAIAQARRTQRKFALLYLDLDRFKVINDGYGHPFGNAVLKTVGEHLLGLMGEGDTVARLGGDEFLVLLADLPGTDAACVLARKIVAYLDTPITVQEREVYVSGSIGISVYPDDGETADALVGNADMAMYRAKDLGRNTYQSFTRAMGEETQHRIEMENRLRGAAAAGQLSLVYQPKVYLETGRIAGCEALLRWRHPELGVVSPARFIPIAEDSGLIVQIGEWVLRTACAQAKAWRDAGRPVCVAVNLSVRQFVQQDVVDWVMNTLRETGLPPELLELELTESLVAEDAEKVIATFNQLKAAGVRLSIDDFGTGYSSLGYLKRFRVDTLKIDQSFVRNMLDDADDAAIVQAVIALAHSLNFRVIAEGVESEQHCRILRESRCDEIQGYYFSRPLAAEDFSRMLAAGRRLSLD